MTDVVGNPEEERRAEFYFQPWAQEAVCRYFYSKVKWIHPMGSLCKWVFWNGTQQLVQDLSALLTSGADFLFLLLPTA